jgi:hypothetical protein
MRHKLYKTLFFLFMILVSYSAKSQVVDLGTPRKAGEFHPGYFGATNKGNSLWVVSQCYDTATTGWVIKISEHDGSGWTDHLKMAATPEKQILLNACFYNGDLYFNASFAQLTLNSVSYQSKHCILKWDGSNLQFIDSIIGNYVSDMDTFNNKLIIEGNFSKIGNVNVPFMAEYDGSSWKSLGTPANWVNFQPTMSQRLGQLVNQGNKLYITGQNKIVDVTKPQYFGLAVYNGTDLSPVDSSEFSGVYSGQGEIYAHPDSNAYYFNDSIYLTFYCEPGKARTVINHDPANYERFNNPRKMFAYRGPSVYTLKATSQGPVIKTTAFIEKLTGKNLKRIYLPDTLKMNINNNYGMFGKDAVFFMMYRINAPIDSTILRFFRLDSSDNLAALLSGKAYIDADNNCQFNPGDIPLANSWMKMTPGNRMSYTDKNGNYIFSGIPGGTFDVSIVKPEFKDLSCPSTGKYSVTITADSNLVRDFGLEFDSTHLDLNVSIYAHAGWRARRGRDELYTVTIKNNSAFTKSGTALVTFDKGLVSPVSQNTELVFTGSKGVLTFTSLSPAQSMSAQFLLKSDSTLDFNTYHNIYAELDSTIKAWDSDSTNDHDTVKVVIVGPYDPNDKTSKPSGNVLPGTRFIQYHINFQNVGNDTAYKVVVVDTIDMRMPLEKIVIGSSSHKFKLNVKDNILSFVFADIKLVDSATNEPGSKGYIRYSAVLNQELPIGASVHNRAHIYFDFNEAIHTNTATVTIKEKEENPSDLQTIDLGSLKIYPNPGSGRVFIENMLEKQSFSLYNVNGMMVISGRLEQGLNEVNVAELPEGIYLLVTGDGQVTARLIVMHP